MRFPLILLTALLLVGQLPAVAFSAMLKPSSAVTLLGQAEQATVHGGICTNCPPKDDAGDSSDPNPVPVGLRYWENTTSRLLSRTQPAYQVIWGYSNFSSNTSANLSHTFSTTSSFNWSISGGLPANIVSAQFGRQHSTTESRTVAVSVPPRTRIELLARTTREQYEYSYSQFQDYSDGSRTSHSHGTVRTNRTYVENANRSYRL